MTPQEKQRLEELQALEAKIDALQDEYDALADKTVQEMPPCKIGDRVRLFLNHVQYGEMLVERIVLMPHKPRAQWKVSGRRIRKNGTLGVQRDYEYCDFGEKL